LLGMTNQELGRASFGWRAASVPSSGQAEGGPYKDEGTDRSVCATRRNLPARLDGAMLQGSDGVAFA
jgi:hypothetical protein